ncbi:hypothetical protein LBMAG42_47880 [Deltaproteobacteria bacterium]|nr:hypothetical protein LBMAG42_47880 [Deltaproteobacteria bacterium]
MSDDALKEIEGLLQAEVEKERASNGRTMKIGGGFGLFVAGYLLWVSWAIGTLLDPAGLAQAAGGFAIGAVPEAGKQVRALVVDGAPELVRMGSDQILGMVPGYRMSLQEEIDPVVEEVSIVLANTAVKELSEHAGDPAAKYSGDAAMQAAADAAVARVDATLSDAMDLPDDEGVTPRDAIGKSLTQLKKIDAQLKIMAKKGGDPQERELLVAWLGVVAQSNEAEQVALQEDYKAAAAAAEKKEDAAAPAPAATATVPAGDAPAPAPGK